MKKLSHIIWTFGISLFIFKYLFETNLFQTILFSFLTSFFSSLPDIDIKIIKRIQEFNKSTFYIFYILTIPFKFLFKHRTWTHTIYFPLIFFYLAEFLFEGYLQVILRILYLTLILHIFEDSFTISGVKLFYPFNFTLRFAKFNTCSFFDYLILNLIGFLIILGFFMNIWLF